MKWMSGCVSVLFAAAVLSSCTKNEDLSPVVKDVSFRGVYVGCQEDGQSGGADIALIHSGEISDDVIRTHNGQPLPEGLVDFQVEGDLGYALCKSTGSLVVIDMRSMLMIDEIAGLGDTRRLLIPDPSVAYVSSGTSTGLVFRLDLNDRAITAAANVGALPGAMSIVDDNIYVGCGSSITMDRGLYGLNAVTLQEMSVVHTAQTPVDLVTDANGQLWMLLQGYASTGGGCDEYLYTTARLASYNPQSAAWTEYAVFGATELYPSHLQRSPDGQFLYYVHHGIHRLHVANPLAHQVLVEAEVNGLEVNPATGELWWWKPGSDMQHHEVVQCDREGNLMNTWQMECHPVAVSFY